MILKVMVDPPLPNVPKWTSISFYDTHSKELFLPASIGGDSEATVSLAIGWDSTKVIHDDGHLYVPLTWLRQNYPKRKDVWDIIGKKKIPGA
jgi:hypothetical protein